MYCFSLPYFVLQDNFQVQDPEGGGGGGACIWRGDLTEGFLRYEFGGLIFGGSYTWRGLFSEFEGSENWRKRIETRVENTQSNFPWRLRHEQ